jgi:hypothetical protein
LNKDYKIDPQAYQWNPKKNVNLEIELPGWLRANSGYELIPGKGVSKQKFNMDGRMLDFKIKQLDAFKIFVFSRNVVNLEDL